MMAEAAMDQKLGTLVRMHEAAFYRWGGVPQELLYDRMKTVWTGTDERGEIVWNTVFREIHAAGCAGRIGRRPTARSNRR